MSNSIIIPQSGHNNEDEDDEEDNEEEALQAQVSPLSPFSSLLWHSYRITNQYLLDNIVYSWKESYNAWGWILKAKKRWINTR